MLLLAFVTQAGLWCASALLPQSRLKGTVGVESHGVFYVTEAGLLAHTS